MAKKKFHKYLVLLLCLSLMLSVTSFAYATEQGDDKPRSSRFLMEEDRNEGRVYPFEFQLDSADADYVTVTFIPFFDANDYTLNITEREELEEYKQRIESGNYTTPNSWEISGIGQTNSKITLKIERDYSFGVRYQEGNMGVSYNGFLRAVKFDNGLSDKEQIAIKTRDIFRNETDLLRLAERNAEADAMAKNQENAAIYEEPEKNMPNSADISTASVWANETIHLAVSAGIVPQHLQSNYQQPITRNEFAALAITFLEIKTGAPMDVLLQEKGITVTAAVFADTDDMQILTAYALGIVSGKGGGVFDPGSSITREEMAAMLTRTQYVLGVDYVVGSSSNYADSYLFSTWAIPYIDYVTNRGIMDGVGDNNFAASGTCTREQAIAVYYRML